MNVTLIVVEGPQKGKKFEFCEPDNFLLGRDNAGSNAHFRLNNDDSQVSRNHFLLEINPPDCYIRDAGSLNGTFIVRPGGKLVYFLPGRKDDHHEYESRGSKLKEKLDFVSLQQADERIKLAGQDIIHVGQTAIRVEIVVSARPQAQQCAESDSHCIECGAVMLNSASRKRAEL